MTPKFLAVASLLFILSAGCGNDPTSPAASTAVQSTTGTSQNFLPSPAGAANGSSTWTMASSSRSLCPEIERQVGETFELWLGMKLSGDAVTLSLAEGPEDPTAANFVGLRHGDVISASRSLVNLGGFGCPGDLTVTPQVGGALTATVTATGIEGEYTEVYGTGANQVTFGFSFRATLPPSS